MGKFGTGDFRGEDWMCKCGGDNFARNTNCFKCGAHKDECRADHAGVGVGEKSEPELGYMDFMKLEIQKMMELAEEKKMAVDYVVDSLLDKVFSQIVLHQDGVQSSPTYNPPSPDYIAAPDSPEYRAAGGSPEYTAPDQGSQSGVTMSHYQAGYDSPMANPSPTYQPVSFESPVYRPSENNEAIDPESRKFKCRFCNEAFDIKFEVYEHLTDVHDIPDDENELNQHCIEPVGATYAPTYGSKETPIDHGHGEVRPNHVTTTFGCAKCDFQTSDKFPMFEHLEEIHGVLEEYFGDNFSLIASSSVGDDSQQPLLESQETNSKGDVLFYQCTFCDEESTEMFFMYQHLEEVHGVSEDDIEKHLKVSSISKHQKQDIEDSGSNKEPQLSDSPQPSTLNQCTTTSKSPETLQHNLTDGAQSNEKLEANESSNPLISSLPGENRKSNIESESDDSGAISHDDDEYDEDSGPSLMKMSNPEPESDRESRSISPLHVSTIDELKKALSGDEDFKIVVSEELTSTDEYMKFMEEFNKREEARLAEEDPTQSDKHDKRIIEIGNVSPEVEDRYFPINEFNSEVDDSPYQEEDCEMKT